MRRSGGERKSKFAWLVSVVARVTHREVVLLVLLPDGVRTVSVASRPAPRLRAARSSRHVTSGCTELLGGRERGRRLCGKLPCGYGAAGHGGRQRGLRWGRKPGRVCGVLPGHVPPPLPSPPRRAPGKRPLTKTKRLGCSGVPVISAAELGISEIQTGAFRCSRTVFGVYEQRANNARAPYGQRANTVRTPYEHRTNTVRTTRREV